MEAFIVEINAWAWGVPMQVLLLGTGIFLTLGLGFLTWRRLGFAFRLLLGGFKGQGEGDIPPFQGIDDFSQCDHWYGQHRWRGDGDHPRRARRALLDVADSAVWNGNEVCRSRASRALSRAR